MRQASNALPVRADADRVPHGDLHFQLNAVLVEYHRRQA
jgi:hypothetical protein